jgi:hypothetical protein
VNVNAKCETGRKGRYRIKMCFFAVLMNTLSCHDPKKMLIATYTYFFCRSGICLIKLSTDENPLHPVRPSMSRQHLPALVLCRVCIESDLSEVLTYLNKEYISSERPDVSSCMFASHLYSVGLKESELGCLFT